MYNYLSSRSIIWVLSKFQLSHDIKYIYFFNILILEFEIILFKISNNHKKSWIYTRIIQNNHILFWIILVYIQFLYYLPILMIHILENIIQIKKIKSIDVFLIIQIKHLSNFESIWNLVFIHHKSIKIHC